MSLDVERLADAIDRIDWPESIYPRGYRDVRWVMAFARAIAAEYAKPTPTRADLLGPSTAEFANLNERLTAKRPGAKRTDWSNVVVDEGDEAP